MTQRQTIDTFTSHFDCELTVVEEGEHWFHTAEQMEILNPVSYTHLDVYKRQPRQM